MGKAVSSIFGGSAPKTSAAPIAVVDEKKREARTSRSALYETEGGVQGAELDPDQVEKRRTLLGN